MTASVIVLSALAAIGGSLSMADHPAPAMGDRPDSAYETSKPKSGGAGDAIMQLAAGGKGGDKYMSGKAGGRYGIGGKGGQSQSGQQGKQGK
jgi:hypothetical protein